MANEINLLLGSLNENPAPGMRTFSMIEAERLERAGEAGELTDDDTAPEEELAGAARPVHADDDVAAEADDDANAEADDSDDESIPVAHAKSLIDRQARDRKVTIAAAGLTAVAGALLGIPW